MTRYLPSIGVMIAILLSATVFLMVSAASSTHGELLAQQAQTPPKDTGSPANSTPQTVDKDGKRIRCDAIPEAKGGLLIGRIIPCLTKTIETSAMSMSAKFIDFLKPLLWSFITLVVVLFGVKIVEGEGQIQVHGLVLLIKITLVLMVLELIPTTLIPTLYGVMSESQAVVMGTLGPDTSSLGCEVDKYMDGNTPLIWAQMDCIMGKLYGYTVGEDTNGVKRPNMLLASSMIGLLGGFFFGGTLGAALFFACVGVLWGMFMLVLRVIMAFVNAYLIIALYMIIAPLFLPLVFMRATTSYFDKWTSGILAGLLMPVVIAAYVTLALQMYDKMMFAPNSLLQNMFDREWVKAGQEMPKEACDRQFTLNPAFRADASGKSENEIYKNPFFKNFINPLLSGGNNLCGGRKLPVFDLDAVKNKQAYNTAKAKFEKLFRDSIMLFIMAWLVDAGFKTVIGAIRPVLGSGALAATLDATSPQEKRLQMAMGSAKREFVAGLRDDNGQDQSGAGFLRSIPGALSGRTTEDGTRRPGALGGFMNGLSRNQD